MIEWNYEMWNICAFVITILFVCSHANAQGILLYKFVDKRPVQDVERLSRMAKLGTYDSEFAIDVDVTALERDWISLELPDGRVFQVRKRPSIEGLWVGNVMGRSGEITVHLLSGKRLSGRIELPGESFYIEPGLEGSHVLQRGTRILPKDSDDTLEPEPEQKKSKATG